MRAASLITLCLLQPSEVLKGYFQDCDEDITSEIVKRVNYLSSNIFPAIQGPSGVACMQSSLARERKSEVCLLFHSL